MPVAKLLGISALAAAALALTIPQTAGAHDRYYGDRYDRYERHHDRYERVRYDRDRRYHRGHRAKVCHVEWRHHHRERVCYWGWR